jgi:hypothetical protein
MMYRVVFVLISAMSVWQSVGLTAATHPRGTETELSQRFVGQWESKLTTKKIAPMKQVFVSMDSRKHFKIVRVYEFGGHQGRIEYEGKWRISSGELVWEYSQLRTFEGSQSGNGIKSNKSCPLQTISLFCADSTAASGI